MDPQLLTSACNLYNTSPEALIPLSGGHYNDVYLFHHGFLGEETSAILRIGVEDCPPNQTLGMLEWVHYLSQEGAPVAAPVRSINNHLLENLKLYGTRYTVTAFEKADGTLAENIPPSDWTNELFQSIGEAVGRLHAVSKCYKPSRPYLKRPAWFEGNEIQDANRRLANPTDPAHHKLASLITELRSLPTSPPDYGLIHDDLHFANFLIQPDGRVIIIDFDDCVYGWFAVDVAMALFDVLVLYDPPDDTESQRFARQFMTSYLDGYRKENDLAPFWLSQIPRFLKLKELCIYADLMNRPELAEPGSWVGRFMRGRAERIAGDLPYVDIDFSTL
jgi:Ser/Thr protein kinase RdoA (MazF antagonist)